MGKSGPWTVILLAKGERLWRWLLLKERKPIKSWLSLFCCSDGVDTWHSRSPLDSSPTLLHTLSEWSQLSISPRWEHANNHSRYYAHMSRRGNNANTCCCKRSCLFIAQTHTYFLESQITMPHTVSFTQLLGWWVQQLFTLWTLSDVQSSTECFMLCSTNHKLD